MRKTMTKSNPVRLSTEQGAALVTTLLLLLLMTAMSLTMVLSVSSDMLINGYYRNYRSRW
jgi:type II secretory pathway component PulK